MDSRGGLRFKQTVSRAHHGRLDPGVELIMKPFTQSDLADRVRRVLATSALNPRAS
jgi:hypothetical protein